MPRLHFLLGLALALAVTASPASAAKCAAVTDTSNLAAISIVRQNTTCRVARDVARRYAEDGLARTVDRLGRTWRCRVTQAATGTDPGSVARTKVRCTRSKAVVRFELAS